MSQKGFQDRNHKTWYEVSQLLDLLDRGSPITGGDSFPEQYRKVCQHLALARYRRYSAEIVEGLNRLALRGHQHLYEKRYFPFRRIGDFIGTEFPRAVRREWKLVLLCIVLFFGSGAATDIAVHYQPDLAYTILGPRSVAQLEMMYDPGSDHFLRERSSDSDLAMFGFYIRNNIGIGFKTFATGLLLGLGAAFFLIFNGIFMGGAAGHIDMVGYGSTFYSFVIGHGALGCGGDEARGDCAGAGPALSSPRPRRGGQEGVGHPVWLHGDARDRCVPRSVLVVIDLRFRHDEAHRGRSPLATRSPVLRRRGEGSSCSLIDSRPCCDRATPSRRSISASP